MVEEKGLPKVTAESTSLDINRFFKAIPRETKEIKVSWHDYEDERSLEKVIHIPVDQDPEAGATSFLMEYVPGRYDFEGVKESWDVEVGPVFEGPGPGDGSDAPFDGVTFYGTEEEAGAKGRELCQKWQSKLGGWDRDLGRFGVGASVTRRA
jgi:hypothetical protein